MKMHIHRLGHPALLTREGNIVHQNEEEMAKYLTDEIAKFILAHRMAASHPSAILRRDNPWLEL